MDNLFVKTYIVNGKLEKIIPNLKRTYTIEIYTESRTHWDNYVTLCINLKLDIHEYVKLMTEKFDCVDFEGRLFFKSKKDCQEAIGFIDSLLILLKLES